MMHRITNEIKILYLDGWLKVSVVVLSIMTFFSFCLIFCTHYLFTPVSCFKPDAGVNEFCAFDFDDDSVGYPLDYYGFEFINWRLLLTLYLMIVSFSISLLLFVYSSYMRKRYNRLNHLFGAMPDDILTSSEQLIAFKNVLWKYRHTLSGGLFYSLCMHFFTLLLLVPSTYCVVQRFGFGEIVHTMAIPSTFTCVINYVGPSGSLQKFSYLCVNSRADLLSMLIFLLILSVTFLMMVLILRILLMIGFVLPGLKFILIWNIFPINFKQTSVVVRRVSSGEIYYFYLLKSFIYSPISDYLLNELWFNDRISV